jgi:hypothetical protein
MGLHVTDGAIRDDSKRPGAGKSIGSRVRPPADGIGPRTGPMGSGRLALEGATGPIPKIRSLKRLFRKSGSPVLKPVSIGRL